MNQNEGIYFSGEGGTLTVKIWTSQVKIGWSGCEREGIVGKKEGMVQELLSHYFDLNIEVEMEIITEIIY